MRILNTITVCIIVVLSTVSSEQTCTRLRQNIKHRFHALRHCQRSNRTIVGLINVNSVADCADYARKKHGMAFNYGPKERNETNFFEVLKAQEAAKSNQSTTPSKGTDTITADPEEFFNCQVLECPEYRNLSTIVNDTRFDYYSLFTRPPPSENATCIPSVGMFILNDNKLNYTQAFNVCHTLGGSLAHVVSEIRTNMLSKMVANEAGANMNRNITSIKENVTLGEAYVGLNEITKGAFITSGKEPLECFLYRAWAPGHPSKTRQAGCVAVTTNHSWTVHNCNKSLQYICELHTSGPPTHKVRLKRKCSLKRPNNRIAPGRHIIP
ncbi:uncharacterized protein LOC134213292 [Armigeres subalbatus]|uniref:uncharacterized protein LOC134213292 n=1 Tax=Armigeres subalbatus TaxID=124917 RepID=UPI002ED58C8B